MPKERLQKIIARAGLASRRQSESFITSGLVTVNGKVAKLGDQAELGVDAIKVKGKLLLPTKMQDHRYVVFYKPRGVICMMSADTEQGRPTLLDFPISREKGNLFPVGRMDFNGEGIVLLTNDGELTQKLQRSKDLVRSYHVKIKGFVDAELLERLRRGGRVGDDFIKPHRVQVLQKMASKSLVELLFMGSGSVLVKEYVESRGFLVERVVRHSFGHLTLKGLKPGENKMIKKEYAQALIDCPHWGLSANPEKEYELTVEPFIKQAKSVTEQPAVATSSGSSKTGTTAITSVPAAVGSSRSALSPMRPLAARASAASAAAARKMPKAAGGGRPDPVTARIGKRKRAEINQETRPSRSPNSRRERSKPRPEARAGGRPSSRAMGSVRLKSGNRR